MRSILLIAMHTMSPKGREPREQHLPARSQGTMVTITSKVKEVAKRA